MTLAISLAISVIFGAGAFLILQRNLIRVVIGVLMISNSAIVFLIAAGLSRGRPPIYPLPEADPVSDPLVQAMALTALVISSSVTALLLGLAYRLYVSHRTVDIEVISEAEVREAEALERGESPEETDAEDTA
ncbi:MAG: sodium:proton antiporter [Actinomycetota bacterium]|nr:sodium:proton antiporter [Actinomycetota bacterium]